MRGFALILISTLFITGCCNVKQAVSIPDVDTVYVADTSDLNDYDSVWIGPINIDNDSVGSIAVYPVSKKAIVKIKYIKGDTVYYEIPTNNYMVFENILLRVLQTAFIAMPFYYQLLLILLLIGALYVVYLIKRKKNDTKL